MSHVRWPTATISGLMKGGKSSTFSCIAASCCSDDFTWISGCRSSVGASMCGPPFRDGAVSVYRICCHLNLHSSKLQLFSTSFLCYFSWHDVLHNPQPVLRPIDLAHHPTSHPDLSAGRSARSARPAVRGGGRWAVATDGRTTGSRGARPAGPRRHRGRFCRAVQGGRRRHRWQGRPRPAAAALCAPGRPARSAPPCVSPSPGAE